MSAHRLDRYLTACHFQSKTAMTLYRKNLRLSQELFTVISCFEVALRNRINKIYTVQHGDNWIRESAARDAHHEPICFAN